MKTNEEAKQEAIIKAFGDKWDLLHHDYQQHLLTKKHWVDQSIGYCAMAGLNVYRQPSPKRIGFEPEEIDVNCEFWRPKSISGIENNNGWTRIEPDGSNLPTDENIKYKVFIIRSTKNPHVSKFNYPKNDVINDFLSGFISHYKPIEEDKPPIY